MRSVQQLLSSRRISVALGLAAVLHATGVLYSSQLPAQSLPPIQVKELDSFWDLELEAESLVKVPQDVVPGERAPGGGSIDPGEAPKSKALAAKPERTTKPVSVAARVAPERLERPAPIVAPRETPAKEPLPAEQAEDVDLFALDSVISADVGQEALAIRTRPEAVRTQLAQSNAAAPERVRATDSSKQIDDSRDFGLGRGRYGGRGGNGAGFGDGRGSFGGARGHFRGQVCFIEPGTKALRHLSLCQVQGEFFTDVFNITPRSFTAGFPGVSERTEWFAILYTGSVQVSEEGQYRFRVVSDDGAILRIDGEVVVDNDGQHGPVSAAALMTLTRGKHQLELRYFQGPRTMVALQVFVTPPGGKEQLLRAKF